MTVPARKKLVAALTLLAGAMLGAAGHSRAQEAGAVETRSSVERDEAGKIRLRILYVGMSGTDRHRDFVDFLSKHFAKVEVASVFEFREEQAKSADVVLLDKDGVQWAGEGGDPLYGLFQASQAYTRATVTLGTPGAFWCDRMNLKPGYR